MGSVTSTMAAKFAFFPPTPPSYGISVDEATGKLRMTEVAEKENTDVLKLKTKRGNEVVPVMVRDPTTKLTVLYSHGNVADIGQMYELFCDLGSHLRVNLMGWHKKNWNPLIATRRSTAGSPCPPPIDYGCPDLPADGTVPSMTDITTTSRRIADTSKSEDLMMGETAAVPGLNCCGLGLCFRAPSEVEFEGNGCRNLPFTTLLQSSSTTAAEKRDQGFGCVV